MAVFSSLLLLSLAITIDTNPLPETSTTAADRQVGPLKYSTSRLLGLANTIQVPKALMQPRQLPQGNLRADDAQVGIFCNSSQTGPIPAAESDFIAKCDGPQSRMSSACA